MRKLFLLLFSVFSLQLMSSDINWSFPPVALSTVGQNASIPQIAIDPNGNVVAIWMEEGFVKSKFKNANMSWSDSIVLSGRNASDPGIVMDPFGTATVIWVENGFVRAASKILNGPWSSPGILSGPNSASPVIAIDSSGDVVAAWARGGVIQTCTKPFWQFWENPMTVSGPGAASPHVALGGSGMNCAVVIVWQVEGASTNQICGTAKPISGSWTPQQIISNTMHEADYASVAVDSQGNAIVVWYSYDVEGINYSGVTVQSASLPFGGSWTLPIDLSDPGIGNPANLTARVACDGLGNAIALWNQSFDGETFDIQSAIKPAYGQWGDPLNLVSGNLYSYQAGLAAASLGDALALYMFYNGSDLLIQSSELDITHFMDALWSVPLIISSGAENAYPWAASAAQGNVINTAAIWISSNGVYNSAVASTGIKSLLQPPSNLSITQSVQNFGVFSEYCNTVRWQASPSSTVSGYLIYRNGVFIEQVSSDVLQIKDQNQVQNGPVTYGIASVDNESSHSQIVTIAL